MQRPIYVSTPNLSAGSSPSTRLLVTSVHKPTLRGKRKSPTDTANWDGDQEEPHDNLRPLHSQSHLPVFDDNTSHTEHPRKSNLLARFVTWFRRKRLGEKRSSQSCRRRGRQLSDPWEEIERRRKEVYQRLQSSLEEDQEYERWLRREMSRFSTDST